MSHSRTARRHLLSAAAVAATLTLGLTACGQGDSDPSESPSTGTSESPSASTSAPATESASPSASSAPASSSASASPSETAEAASAPTVFWVTEDLDAAGAVEFPGCGDTVLLERPAEGAEAGTIGDPAHVEAALQALLDQEWEVGEGLTNSLDNSELEINGVSIDGDTAVVDLSGMPISAGTCDDPRIIAQLEHTAMANAGTESVEVIVDGTPLAEFFDHRG